MPGVVDTTHTFATNDVVTSTLLNNIIDQTLFTSDALSGGTLALTSGKMKVATSGVTSNELAANAVTTSAIASSTSATSGVTYAKMQYAANMKALGNVSGSLGVVSEVSILDEDDMVSDSATSLATQQSIKAYTDTKVAAAVAASFVRGTAVATTSGTSVDFTSIPSTVKRITVLFRGFSTSGNSVPCVRLGTSSGIVSTGYLGSMSGNTVRNVFTTGFGIQSTDGSNVIHGAITITNIDSNFWVATGTLGASNGALTMETAGSVDLAAQMTQLRITTTNGTDTFDAGQVNIMYE
jgi:hypothetical protein